MKMLPIPEVDPNRVAWTHVGVMALGPFLTLALLTVGLKTMPVNDFVLLYLCLVSAGFLAIGISYYMERRIAKKLQRFPVDRPSCWSGDSYVPSGEAREQHLAMMTRTLKEHHRSDHRQA